MEIGKRSSDDWEKRVAKIGYNITKKWFNEGEPALTLNEIIKINKWFCKELEKFKTFREFQEVWGNYLIGNDISNWDVDCFALLSEKEGLKIIKNID